MVLLREAARQDTSGIYVTTFYDPKIIADLKGRGYRWSPGEAGRPRACYLEGNGDCDTELTYFDATRRGSGGSR